MQMLKMLELLFLLLYLMKLSPTCVTGPSQDFAGGPRSAGHQLVIRWCMHALHWETCHQVCDHMSTMLLYNNLESVDYVVAPDSSLVSVNKGLSSALL